MTNRHAFRFFGENHTAQKDQQFKFLIFLTFKCSAPTPNSDTIHSRAERVHKLARHEVDGF